MKERPILMTPENAQKVHDGTKTQTRRIIKSQPAWVDEVALQRKYRTGMLTCPYGQVGDRLWIREAHRIIVLENEQELIDYKGAPVRRMRDILDMSGWLPSIHMPRERCRTVVELTDVRVERVQEISEADALEEGIRAVGNGTFDGGGPAMGLTAQIAFMRLWNSINGQDSWALNPWVWVLTFRKVEP